MAYGTCWIGAFDETAVKELLGVPEYKKVVICMTLGMPKGEPFHSGRKPLDEFIYLDRYGHPWKHTA